MKRERALVYRLYKLEAHRTANRFGASILTRLCLCFAFSLVLFLQSAKADFPNAIVFISASLTFEDGRPAKSLGTGTGFVINKKGYVVTAKHVIPKEVPAGATLVLTGSVRSRGNPAITLIGAEIVTLGVDIT